MGGGHGHGHHDGHHDGERRVRPLALSLAVLAAFLAVEVVVGLRASSLVLLSDAGHMVTDVLGVTMALGALLLARHGSSSGRNTFGLHRAEVLVALGNAVLLFGVALAVVVAAVRRWGDPPAVPGTAMVAVAVAGLVANATVFGLLRRSSEGLAVRAALLEVTADAVGGVGVLLAGTLTLAFGWRWADPVLAVAIGLFVLPRTARIAAAALRILVQGAPAHVDVAAVRADLAAVPGVLDAHDVHVWTLTSGMEVVSAHLTAGPGADAAAVLSAAQDVLAGGHRLEHATVQVEPASATACCHALHW